MSCTIVISASYDKQIRCWDAATGRTVRSFTFQDSQINSIHLVYQTHYLAVAGFSVIRLYDMSDINYGNIADSQAPHQKQQMVTIAPGGQTVVTPPPIFSSYETQGGENFTSLGSFLLLPRKTVAYPEDLSSNNTVNVVDAVLSTCEYGSIATSDFSPVTISLKPSEKHSGSIVDDMRVILYATSEDGHIRFFDAKTPNVLCILRDITTGAAITCSCLSPDSRFLLTGSQIGQVSVWHLPTIIASIAREQQQQRYQAASAEGTALKEPISSDTQEAAERAAAIGKFGRRPVHEFALEGDYTSVRSISIDPLVRWFVVATNQGKLHFFRFTHDISLRGTKSAQGSQSLKVGACGEGTRAAPVAVSTASPEFVNDVGNSSFCLKHHGEAELSNNSPSSHIILRESAFHPTFVSNEFKDYLKCSPDVNVATGHRGSHTVNTQVDSNATLGGYYPNSTGIGVALPHLEQHHCNNNNIDTFSSTPQKLESRSDKVNATSQKRTPSPCPISLPIAVTGGLQMALQKDMETEEFYTFRAHYKYILRVVVSPNGELLTTCCADYTVGRFIIPEIMRGGGIGRGTLQVLNLEGNSFMIYPEQQVSTFKLDLKPVSQNGINDSMKHAVGKVSVPLMHVSYVSEAVQRSADNLNTSNKFDKGTDVVHEDTTDAIVGVQSSLSEQSQVTGVNKVVTKDAPSSSAAQNENTQQEPLVLIKGSEATIGNISLADANSSVTVFSGGSQLGMDTQANNPKGESTMCSNIQSKKHELDLYFKPLPSLTNHTRWVWDCVFSDCSQFLFTASSDCHVRMWNNISSDRPQSTVFVGHTKPVIAVLLAYNL